MVSERDSAGIVIVENRIDTAPVRRGWRVAAEPDLVLGGLDAPESQQLYQVRGARLLAGGRVAIADGGSSQVRVYDGSGELVAFHGREGEGPGEFMHPVLVDALGGDTLVVYDNALRRVSLVHADSGFQRSYPVGAEGGGFPVAVGLAPDGGIAFGGGMFFSSDQGFPSGAVRPSSRYVLLHPDGSVRADWGEVPAAEMFARTDGGSFSATSLPFGRSTAAAVAGDRFWLGTADGWEIDGYTLDAELARIVRVALPEVRVTAALRDADLEEHLEAAADEDEARRIRASFADMPIPELVPPYQLFRVDAAGNLWVGEYLLPGAAARDYTVIDPEGHVVGRVTMPERTLPTDIGADYVLGVTRDELDVERVTLWHLERPRDSGS